MVTLAPRWVSELHMMTGIRCPSARNSSQRHQAVHHRHLHVQQNQIGAKRFNGAQSGFAIGRGAGHFQSGVGS